MSKTYTLRIYRGSPGNQYWEEFELEFSPNDNVISALMAIRSHPVTKEGKKVTPVAWEAGCLEEVCGSCSMLIDGFPRQACTALIATYLKNNCDRVIKLAPFTKFPLVRDLVVDRSQMFENLKRVHAWIDTVGSKDESGFGPLISSDKQEVMYALSKCMTCGCCAEACPQVNAKSQFIGPAPVAQARLFNANPTGKMQRHLRLRPMMEEGGISECGNAQNCVQVCPKHVPLTDSIAAIGRETTLQGLRDLFSFHDLE